MPRHERLVYEKLKRQRGASAAQALLVPLIVEMAEGEDGALLEVRSGALRRARARDRAFRGRGRSAVSAVPAILAGGDITGWCVSLLPGSRAPGAARLKRSSIMC